MRGMVWNQWQAGAGLSVNQENTVNSLIAQRDDLLQTRGRLDAQVQKLTQDNIYLTETSQRHESEKIQSEAEAANIRDILNAKRTEAERELRRRERLEKELEELRTTCHERDRALTSIKNDIKAQEAQRDEILKDLNEKKQIVEREKDQEAKLLEDIGELKRRNAQEADHHVELHKAGLALQQELKTRQEEIKHWTGERDKTQKQYDQLKKRKAQDDDKRHELEISRNMLKADTESLIREIEQLRKQVESDGKTIADIVRERETLTRGVLKTDEKTKKQTEVVKVHESETQRLDKEVSRVKLELQEAVTRVHELDKAREKYGVDLSMANSKYMAALEELKNRDNKIAEAKKNLADVKGKLQQQKQLYEGVRTDRNLYSKNLVESQDEIAEMRRKFKIMAHQIEQLKEEIKEKDATLVKEHHDHTRVQNQCELIKDQMEKAKQRHAQLTSQKDTQRAEIKKLESRIHELEANRNAQKAKYAEIISERDVLGTQLIRRNDELALLYEKIKIQQRTLQEGEIAYKQRQEEIRGLKTKEASLTRELTIGLSKVSDIDGLKKEVLQLQRELLQERTKVKALSEELENPMNMHRWRKLEGSDPAKHAMTQRVKALQKRLISKCEEAVEKDLAIKDKEKLYLELQLLLEKQPGPEVVEEVGRQQQSLKEKTKAMKSMAAELNMYHSQLNDYKDEIERLTKEMQDTKRKYYEQRHREQLMKDASRSDRPSAGGTSGARLSVGLA